MVTNDHIRLLETARTMLERLPAKKWSWEHVEGADQGDIEAVDGGIIAYVPPFACVHTIHSRGTHYSHPVARFIAASPELVAGLCDALEAAEARIRDLERDVDAAPCGCLRYVASPPGQPRFVADTNCSHCGGTGGRVVSP